MIWNGKTNNEAEEVVTLGRFSVSEPLDDKLETILVQS